MVVVFTASGVSYKLLVSRQSRQDSEVRLKDIRPDRTRISWRKYGKKPARRDSWPDPDPQDDE